METSKVCAVCGDSFTPKAANQVYCGKECRRSAEAGVCRSKRPMGRCVVCSKPFVRRNERHVCCGDARCVRVVANDARRDRPSRKAESANHCKSDFEPVYKTRKCAEKGCNNMTYNYRCDRCWEKRNRCVGEYGGLLGSVGAFAGGHINTAHVVVG